MNNKIDINKYKSLLENIKQAYKKICRRISRF